MNPSNEPPDYRSGPGELGVVSSQDFSDERPFRLERGGELPSINLRYETYGELAPDKGNAILICHALTGDHHCAGIHTPDERKPGWWNHAVGPGKTIDTDRFHVICSNCLGACQGSTGPTSANPDTGKPYGVDFPDLTIADMVAAQKRLIDHLGIEHLYAVIGGSMGGMQVLQWAVSFPEMVERAVVIAATTRHNAQTIAFNEVGRAAIQGDPKWNGGDYPADGGPDVGLAIARMMAHITYLSDKGMELKFGRARRENIDEEEARESPFGVEFEVESYLRHQGKTFVNRFDANTYLHLTKALDRFDLHDEDGELEASLDRIRARVLTVGFTSDWLYTPRQNRRIAETLQRLGRDASYAEIDHDYGHDSFLLRSPEFHGLIRAFLRGDAAAADNEGTSHTRKTSKGRASAKKEADFRIIDEWVEENESVLDLGCGRGLLLQHLAQAKNVRVLGVDLDFDKVAGCVARGVPAHQGDARKTLAGFRDDSFDRVVLSRTLEELDRPGEIIEDALRVARRVVVSFVNHGYLVNRLHYFLKGNRILNDVYRFPWHERSPANPLTLRDFETFCRERGLQASRRVCLGGDWRSRCRFLPNLMAGVAIYEVIRS